MSTYYYFYVKNGDSFTCIAEVSRNDEIFDSTTYLTDNCYGSVKPLSEEDILWYIGYCKDRIKNFKDSMKMSEEAFQKYIETVKSVLDPKVLREDIYEYFADAESNKEYYETLIRQLHFAEFLWRIISTYDYTSFNKDDVLYIGCETGIKYENKAEESLNELMKHPDLTTIYVDDRGVLAIPVE